MREFDPKLETIDDLRAEIRALRALVWLLAGVYLRRSVNKEARSEKLALHGDLSILQNLLQDAPDGPEDDEVRRRLQNLSQVLQMVSAESGPFPGIEDAV